MKIDSHTSLYCILGNPVHHSLSPCIHNAGFQKLKINAVYVAFETENIENAIRGIRALGIKGCSVTIPFKTEVIKYLDEILEIGRLIGAVNTIINKGGRLIGTNTDAFGFYKALSYKTEITDKTIAIFGSGGAARAGIFSLFYYDKPSKVIIVARNREKREEIKAEIFNSFKKIGREISDDCLTTRDLSEWKNFMNEVDIIINTTPVGMTPEISNSILETDEIPEEKIVMDIVYNPFETKFLKLAKSKKCKVIPGIDMLLLQGIKQFELWTEVSPPVNTMRKALKKAISKKVAKR
ncbi:MAG: shikimate dehydrogenase [Brevinematia bacterium]